MSKELCEGLRERQRLQRVDAILDAAAALVRDVGYEAMTMDALAARAGLTKPTLYAHFPNKEAIAVASVVRRIHDAQARLEALDPTLSPLVRLEGLFRWALTTKLVQRSIPFSAAAAHVIRSHPDYQAAYARLTAAQCALIEEGQQGGEIDPDLVPIAVIQAFVAIMRDSDFDRLPNSSALVETLVTLLIRPLRRTP